MRKSRGIKCLAASVHQGRRFGATDMHQTGGLQVGHNLPRGSMSGQGPALRHENLYNQNVNTRPTQASGSTGGVANLATKISAALLNSIASCSVDTVLGMECEHVRTASPDVGRPLGLILGSVGPMRPSSHKAKNSTQMNRSNLFDGLWLIYQLSPPDAKGRSQEFARC